MKFNYSYLDKKRLGNSKINFANRGMALESDINLSNEYYRVNDIAYIYKKPTPIKLVKVDYQKSLINEAYFLTPSTTDYNGKYKGKYIDFEAKETTCKTSFALANIHEHQIKHLIDVQRHGAISFLIVRFIHNNETYLLDTMDLKYFLENYDRKSIPLSFFKERGKLVKMKYNPRLDYIEVINNTYFGGNNHDEEKTK